MSSEWVGVAVAALAVLVTVIGLVVAHRNRSRDRELAEADRRAAAQREQDRLRRDDERRQLETYRRDVLKPLLHRFKVSERLSRRLLIEPYYLDLEWPPSRLREIYETHLPPGDPRRASWEDMLDELHESNEQAIELIAAGIGDFKTHDLRQAAVQFEAHAREWRTVWVAKENPPPPPDDPATEQTEHTPPFPSAIVDALNTELAATDARLRELAGTAE